MWPRFEACGPLQWFLVTTYIKLKLKPLFPLSLMMIAFQLKTKPLKSILYSVYPTEMVTLKLPPCSIHRVYTYPIKINQRKWFTTPVETEPGGGGGGDVFNTSKFYYNASQAPWAGPQFDKKKKKKKKKVAVLSNQPKPSPPWRLNLLITTIARHSTTVNNLPT